jgi:malate dehydrogenase (oxaloacetate-decarboxylating)
MPYFTEHYTPDGRIQHITTPLRGKNLLNTSQLNKGCAFTKEERKNLQLDGLLPESIETLQQQTNRCYNRYLSYSNPLNRHIFLKNLYCYNEILFYKLITEHLEEMLPTIYTPTVGEAVKQFSHEFSQSNGIYISYPNRNKISEILKSLHPDHTKLFVITDGEGVLGIGDQGIGGMSISIAKLMVYTLCGGLNPRHIVPIQLDVGTNNTSLLNDPMYLGWRASRISDPDYDSFIQTFINETKKTFPKIFLHWEDFGYHNARKLLERYKDKICSFNDDMQGTGSVALATLLIASKIAQLDLGQHRIIILGSGTAGLGIADIIKHAMQNIGIQQPEKAFWLIDRQGLLTKEDQNISESQRIYARDNAETKTWNRDATGCISLETVVQMVKPTILIGCSTASGAFHENIVQTMHKHTPRPIIMPLSNPTDRAEAKPEDLIKWTNGQALIATGSPFPPVLYQGKSHPIAQCNNAYIFPGIGLGALAAQTTMISNGMLSAACEALCQYALENQESPSQLLPNLGHIHKVSKFIAKAVAKQALAENLSHYQELDDYTLEVAINRNSWTPEYRSILPE